MGTPVVHRNGSRLVGHEYDFKSSGFYPKGQPRGIYLELWGRHTCTPQGLFLQILHPLRGVLWDLNENPPYFESCLRCTLCVIFD